jgi:hypothetical protein
MGSGPVGHGDGAGLFVARRGNGFEHGFLAFSLSGGIAQRDAWRNFKPLKNQLSTPPAKKIIDRAGFSAAAGTAAALPPCGPRRAAG